MSKELTKLNGHIKKLLSTDFPLTKFSIKKIKDENNEIAIQIKWENLPLKDQVWDSLEKLLENISNTPVYEEFNAIDLQRTHGKYDFTILWNQGDRYLIQFEGREGTDIVSLELLKKLKQKYTWTNY